MKKQPVRRRRVRVNRNPPFTKADRDIKSYFLRRGSPNAKTRLGE